jgi:peroxiredoxin
LAEKHQEFLDAGVQILTVVNASPEKALDYVTRNGLPFPCLVDAEHAVYDLYQVESKVVSLGQRPGLFVIDRNGVTRLAYIGWQQWEIPLNGKVLELCHGLPCRPG